MRKIIFIYIIKQLLYVTSRVESLTGNREKITLARNGEFPFIASLQNHPEGHNFCTGSLITRKHVITAAHCCHGEEPEGVRIVFGMVNFPTDIRPTVHTTDVGHTVHPTDVIRHTVVSWLTYVDWAHRLGLRIQLGLHDIAIIKLKNRVSQPHVHPVRLSDLHKKQLIGKMVTIIGWRGDDRSRILKKAKVKLMSDEDCLRNVYLITHDNLETVSSVMCTAATPPVLLEQGDSGAPLLDRENHHLIGVSAGKCPNSGCVWGNFSAAFLEKYKVNLHFNIDYYRYFIVNSTGDQC